MLRKIIALSLVLVFSMTFLSIGTSQIGNASGNLVLPQSTIINTPGCNTYMGGCQLYQTVSSAGDTNTLYVCSMIAHKGTTPYIVYLVEEQASVQPGSSQLIAGGNHLTNKPNNPTWSSENGFQWASYCSNDASSPSQWNSYTASVSHLASPTGCVNYGASGTTSVTIGVNAGATYDGLSASGSYSYSVQTPTYAFYECPIVLQCNQYCMKFSDNEGAFGGNPKAFTLYYVTEQPAIPGDYMHIYPYSTAHFLVSCSVSGFWVWTTYTPTYSTAHAAGGYSVYIPN